MNSDWSSYIWTGKKGGFINYNTSGNNLSKSLLALPVSKSDNRPTNMTEAEISSMFIFRFRPELFLELNPIHKMNISVIIYALSINGSILQYVNQLTIPTEIIIKILKNGGNYLRHLIPSLQTLEIAEISLISTSGFAFRFLTDDNKKNARFVILAINSCENSNINDYILQHIPITAPTYICNNNRLTMSSYKTPFEIMCCFPHRKLRNNKTIDTHFHFA